MPYKDPKQRREATRRWTEKNHKRKNASTVLWQRKNPEKVWKYRLKTVYNLNLDEFEAIWECQKGLCAICSKVLERIPHGYTVDHNHKTGKVRGLLCSRCNSMLRSFEEGEAWQKAAESYLSQFPA